MKKILIFITLLAGLLCSSAFAYDDTEGFIYAIAISNEQGPTRHLGYVVKSGTRNDLGVLKENLKSLMGDRYSNAKIRVSSSFFDYGPKAKYMKVVQFKTKEGAVFFSFGFGVTSNEALEYAIQFNKDKPYDIVESKYIATVAE